MKVAAGKRASPTTCSRLSLFFLFFFCLINTYMYSGRKSAGSHPSHSAICSGATFGKYFWYASRRARFAVRDASKRCVYSLIRAKPFQSKHKEKEKKEEEKGILKRKKRVNQIACKLINGYLQIQTSLPCGLLPASIVPLSLFNDAKWVQHQVDTYPFALKTHTGNDYVADKIAS